VTNATALVVFRAFPALIIGGLDSVLGAVVGGFVVGLGEVLIGTYTAGMSATLGVGFGLIVPYLLMLVFLLIRPYGLFGTEEIRRV
jgi:branched-chain amino acid transport system permease protein